ncbi:phosphotransferase enzyme family protein [Bacillus sp. CGMCC 1.16607]|uniref:phosphotransferase enzyme family protein n=1 Tax=Bacillus sp. CGMCC 1.16607 TaxID=3351842 RepID=UPI00362D6490
MMKLTMMRDLLESETHQNFINSVLENWGYDQDSVRFIRASSNFIYSFEHNSNKYILRLTPEKNINELENEISFLNFLSEQDVSVNAPIKSINGNTIEIINDTLGIFYAVVFPYFEGKLYEIEELNNNQFVLWGEALGTLHKSSKKFSSIHNQEGTQSIKELLNRLDRTLPLNEVEARNEFELLRDWMEHLNQTELNYGRIHYDFELDNLIWADEKIQMIDFEDGINCWYAADIAFALRDLFENEVNLSNKSFQLFLKGYSKEMVITEQEVKEIPMFLRLHNLIMFGHLLETIDIDSSTENPQWVIGLKNKLILKIAQYREGFKR